MTAPGVVLVSVTVCALEYVPAAGENVGATARVEECTVTTTSSVTAGHIVNSVSCPVSRRVNVPGAENVAVVDNADALPNVTVPGPLTRLHIVVSVPLPNVVAPYVAVPVSVAALP